MSNYAGNGRFRVAFPVHPDDGGDLVRLPSLTLRHRFRMLRSFRMNRLSLLRNAVLGLPLLLLLSGCMTLRDHGELNDPGYVELDQI